MVLRMRNLYVIATLGTSPAVISELIYALVTESRCDVVGIEVWTTTKGRDDLRTFIASGAWTRLKEAIAHRNVDSQLPDPTVNDTDLDAVGHAVTRGTRPFLVRVFEGERGPLDDVRSPDDARVMDAKLFERMRMLTESLTNVQIVGSLAGGRKTMSAGLQGAFSMLGRPEDRLVHVLLEPKVEGYAQTRRDYSVPTVECASETGVPVEAQVALHEVHFPRLRELLYLGKLEHKAVVDLIAQDYPTFLSSMSRLQTRNTGTLRRHHRKTTFDLTISAQGELVHNVSLPRAIGRLFAALVELGGVATLDDLHARLIERGDIEDFDDPEDRERSFNRLSQRIRELKRLLQPLIPRGYGPFAIQRVSRGRYRVEAAVEGLITVDPHDLWD